MKQFLFACIVMFIAASTSVYALSDVEVRERIDRLNSLLAEIDPDEDSFNANFYWFLIDAKLQYILEKDPRKFYGRNRFGKVYHNVRYRYFSDEDAIARWRTYEDFLLRKAWKFRKQYKIGE